MSYKNVQRWRYKARRWITSYMGGRCQCCGYDKYYGNLVGHHLGDKVDGLSTMINRCDSLDAIIAEADKCVLVCHNCHGEIHAGVRMCPSIDKEKREAVLEVLKLEIPTPFRRDCKVCNKKVQTSKNHYCSNECRSFASRKVSWPENLKELVESSSKTCVAKSLGVSDKAVAKFLKNHYP